MKEYEASLNPAEHILDRLKASHPAGLKLEAFEQMLCQITRLDIVTSYITIIYPAHFVKETDSMQILSFF